MQAIEETPPPASASKINTRCRSRYSAEAAAAGATNLESMLSAIDKVLLDIAAEETTAAIEEVLAAVPEKGKEVAEDTSEEKGFSFQNLVGQRIIQSREGGAAGVCYILWQPTRSHALWRNQ
jgi:soluble cytochrome b562